MAISGKQAADLFDNSVAPKKSGVVEFLKQIIRPVNDLGNYLGEASQYSKEGNPDGYQAKFIKQEDFDKNKNNLNWKAYQNLLGTLGLVAPAEGVAGAAVAGGLSGASEGDSLDEVLSNAAKGAGIGAGLGLAGKVIAGKGDKVAKAAETTASTEKPLSRYAKLNQFADDIDNGVAKSSSAKVIDNLKKGQLEATRGKGFGSYSKMGKDADLVSQAMDVYGIKTPNKAKALDELAPKIGKDISRQYAKHSKQYGAIFDSNDLISQLDQDQMRKLAFDFGDTPEGLTTYLRDRMNSYGAPVPHTGTGQDFMDALVGSRKLDANGLWKLKKDLQKSVVKVAKKQNLSKTDELDLALYEVVNNTLMNEPSLAPLKGLNRTYNAMNSVYDKTVANRRRGSFMRLPGWGSGIGDQVGAGIPLGNAVSDAKVRLGQTLSGNAGKVKGVSNITGNAGKIAQMREFLRNNPMYVGGVVQGVENQPQQDQPQSKYDPLIDYLYKGGDMGSGSTPSNGTGQKGSQSSRQQEFQRLTQFVGQKGSPFKTMSDVKTYLDGIYGKETAPSSGVSKLNPKDVANAQSGLDAVNTLRNIISTKGTGKLWSSHLPGILQDSDTQVLTSAKNEISDVIARLRTGAALTKSEEEFYKKQLPTESDKPEVIDQKLKRFEKLFQKLSGGSQSSPQSDLEDLLQQLYG